MVSVKQAAEFATRPEAAEATVRECVELAIDRVWMHRLYGDGSVSPNTLAYGVQHGVTVIAGGCPLMFGPTADTGHKIIRLVGTANGKVPRRA